MKQVKVEWCENFIRARFTKHHAFPGPNAGIEVNCFWKMAEASGLWERGTYDQYDKMLKSADVLQPTVENLYRLAKDIKEHSEGQTITNVMFILERDAVTTIFEIDGSDEI